MNKSVNLVFTSKFIQLESQINAGLSWRDTSIPPIFIPLTSTNKELGLAILVALENSTEISRTHAHQAYLARNNDEYKAFMANEYAEIAKNYSYKNTTAVRKDLMQVSISFMSSYDSIYFYSDYRRKFGYEGIEEFSIPFNSTAEKIGEAAKKAMLKCKSIYRGMLQIEQINQF